ncbi:DMP19 family protein [Lacinutrix sp. MEBiC02404]
MNIVINELEGKETNEKFGIISAEVYNRHIDYENIEIYENPLKNLIYLLNMQGQVDNGGVTQFVDNATGDNFTETKIALKEIGMESYHDILFEIEKSFPNSIVPKNQEKRRDAIDNMSKTDEERWEIEEQYENYDNVFYEKEDEFKSKFIEYFMTFK